MMIYFPEINYPLITGALNMIILEEVFFTHIAGGMDIYNVINTVFSLCRIPGFVEHVPNQ
jgi:hypothetical protein